MKEVYTEFKNFISLIISQNATYVNTVFRSSSIAEFIVMGGMEQLPSVKVSADATILSFRN